MQRVFIDSSAWLAYYLSDEPGHIRVKNLIKNLAKEGSTIVTSNDVIDETVTFLVYHKPILATKLIDFFKRMLSMNSLVQLWIDEEIQNEAFELVKKYSEHKLSLTDCTSIILVKRNKIDSVISLDSDFRKVGISTLP